MAEAVNSIKQQCNEVDRMIRPILIEGAEAEVSRRVQTFWGLKMKNRKKGSDVCVFHFSFFPFFFIFSLFSFLFGLIMTEIKGATNIK